MSAHITCLTTGGVPLFTRSRGKTENLPFSVIGSLNGTHMFSKSHNLELISSETEDYKVVWREFHESITLIGISSSCSTKILYELLNSIYNAIILIVGIDEIKSQKNIERLKRELRVIYPVVDRLLYTLDIGDTSNKFSTELVKLVEVILCQENHLIEVVLDSFSECVDSMFSCVLIHGKIAAATEQWWNLHPDEMKLLSLLAVTENSSSPVDLPIFLPYRSPNVILIQALSQVAFRFVALSLIQDIHVCCLCGPTPLLPDIQHSAVQCFKNSIDFLNNASQCHGRNFPLSLQIDSAILGLLLINYKLGKYMISHNPQSGGNNKRSTSSHRLDILKTFYYQSVQTFLIQDAQMTDDEDKNQSKDAITKDIVGKETYWCSEYHKCHAAKDNDNILCILYKSSVPTHTMRFLTFNTLKFLISDKQVCW